MRKCPAYSAHCTGWADLRRHAAYDHQLTSAQLEWVFHPFSRPLVAQREGYDGSDVPAIWRRLRGARSGSLQA